MRFLRSYCVGVMRDDCSSSHKVCYAFPRYIKFCGCAQFLDYMAQCVWFTKVKGLVE